MAVIRDPGSGAPRLVQTEECHSLEVQPWDRHRSPGLNRPLELLPLFLPLGVFQGLGDKEEFGLSGSTQY